MSVIFIVLIGKPLIWLMYGEEYLGSYGATVIIVMGGIGMVFYKMIYSYNVIHNRRVENLVLLVISAIINIITNAILIPLWGINGAALASLISYLCCGIMFIVSFVKLTKLPVRSLFFLQKSDIELLKSLRRKRTPPNDTQE